MEKGKYNISILIVDYIIQGKKMENLGLYQDIAKRTQGDIYVGVVGPVRTRKIHFHKKIYGFACNS